MSDDQDKQEVEEELYDENSRIMKLSDFNTDYDAYAFNRGLEDASYWAGFFIALVDIGLHPKDAYQFMSNKAVLDSESRIAEINKEIAMFVAESKKNDEL